MEASKPAKTGDTARIASKTFTPSENSCLNFFYHMYGISMGDLNVYVRNEFDEQEVLLWSMSGNQGTKWKQAKVPLPYVSSVPFQVSMYSCHYFCCCSHVMIVIRTND